MADKLKKENNYYSALVDIFLENLNSRSQEIFKRRFGLLGRKKETLEKIGDNFDITRERVRQIIADCLKKAADFKKKQAFTDFENKIIFTIESKNGIMNQEEALEFFTKGDEREKNSFLFLVRYSDKIKFCEIKNLIRPSWTTKSFSLEKIREIEKDIYETLLREKKIVSLKNLLDFVNKKPETKKDGKEKADLAKNWLNILARIGKNKFNKWGLNYWSEITPKNTRDKIYLVLKESKKPLHFREIAEKMDESGLSKRKSHPQTVHNELIKDVRFVLVGRGIYALAERGYFKGTVREVLKKTLEDKKSLSKDELVAEVLKVRKVKEATIIINLKDNSLFIQKNGLYALKKNK